MCSPSIFSRCRDGVVAPEVPAPSCEWLYSRCGRTCRGDRLKFAEHMPLYRFEDISSRYGLHLPRSTLCDWVRNVADLLKPLYEFPKDMVQSAPVIWTDART